MPAVLMVYGPSYTDLFSRAAALRGQNSQRNASPLNLPIEQPTKFEFVINLPAAKQIGVTIPPVRAVSGGQGD